MPQKALSVAFEAVAATRTSTLLVAGDGPERAKVEAGAPANVRFLGAQPRERVFELMRARRRHAALLATGRASALVVAESLAVGTPVLAASAGGVGEVLETAERAARRRRRRRRRWPPRSAGSSPTRELRERLRASAAPGPFADSRRTQIYPRYEAILEEAAR